MPDTRIERLETLSDDLASILTDDIDLDVLQLCLHARKRINHLSRTINAAASLPVIQRTIFGEDTTGEYSCVTNNQKTVAYIALIPCDQSSPNDHVFIVVLDAKTRHVQDILLESGLFYGKNGDCCMISMQSAKVYVFEETQNDTPGDNDKVIGQQMYEIMSGKKQSVLIRDAKINISELDNDIAYYETTIYKNIDSMIERLETIKSLSDPAVLNASCI